MGTIITGVISALLLTSVVALPPKRIRRDTEIATQNFVGEGTNELATAILQGFVDTDENLAFSPLGHSVLLAILAEGANGETREQLVKAIHLPDNIALRRSSYRDVLQRLTEKYSTNIPQFRNWFYIYKNFSVEQEYKKNLEENYLTEVRDVDRLDSETSTETPELEGSAEESTENNEKNIMPDKMEDVNMTEKMEEIKTTENKEEDLKNPEKIDPISTDKIAEKLENDMTEEKTEVENIPEKIEDAAIPEKIEDSESPEKIEESIMPEKTDDSIMPEKIDESTMPEKTDDSIMPEKIDESIIPENPISSEKIDDLKSPEKTEDSKVEIKPEMPDEKTEDKIPEKIDEDKEESMQLSDVEAPSKDKGMSESRQFSSMNEKDPDTWGKRWQELNANKDIHKAQTPFHPSHRSDDKIVEKKVFKNTETEKVDITDKQEVKDDKKSQLIDMIKQDFKESIKEIMNIDKKEPEKEITNDNASDMKEEVKEPVEKTEDIKEDMKEGMAGDTGVITEEIINTSPMSEEKIILEEIKDKQDSILALERNRRGAGGNFGVYLQKNDVSSSLSGNNIVIKSTKNKKISQILVFNAMYFKGNWEVPFTRQKIDSFYKSDIEKSTVTMMGTQGTFKVGNIPDLDSVAIELPYQGGRYSLLIVKPNSRTGLRELISDLTGYPLRNIQKHLTPQEVEVCLPSFEIQTTTNPVEAISKLGVTDVFNQEAADLSGISKDSGLFVEELVQYVTVKVDEGSSSYNYMSASNPSTRTTISKYSADSPFLYFVRDNKEDIVIVAGKVVDPSIVPRRP